MAGWRERSTWSAAGVVKLCILSVHVLESHYDDRTFCGDARRQSCSSQTSRGCHRFLQPFSGTFHKQLPSVDCCLFHANSLPIMKVCYPWGRPNEGAVVFSLPMLYFRAKLAALLNTYCASTRGIAIVPGLLSPFFGGILSNCDNFTQ